jgi:hypothetical protein
LVISQVELSRSPGWKKTGSHRVTGLEPRDGRPDGDYLAGSIRGGHLSLDVSTCEVSPLNAISVVQRDGLDCHEAFVGFEVVGARSGLSLSNEIVGGGVFTIDPATAVIHREKPSVRF